MYKEIEPLQFIKDFSGIIKIVRLMENKFLNKYNLTHFHARYLINLYIYKQMTMSELTALTGIDKANTTRAVRDLLNYGYIQKVGENKRKFLLKLSPLGSKVAIDYNKCIKKFYKEVLVDFTKEELEELSKLTQKVMLGVKNARNEKDKKDL